MVSQGLWGAIEQFWTVEDKVRLHRKNTYFEDKLLISEVHFLVIATIVLAMVIGLMSYFMVMGLVL